MKSKKVKGRIMMLLIIGIALFYSCRPDEEGIAKNDPPKEVPGESLEVITGKITERVLLKEI